MESICSYCGAKNLEENIFCSSCGREISRTETLQIADANTNMTNAKTIKASVPVFDWSINDTMVATEGDMSFRLSLSTGRFGETISPIRCIVVEFRKIVQGFKIALTDKKKLIPAVVMSVLWLLLTLLPIFQINTPVVKWLSFLTFAKGGTQGGILGAIGGIVGKGVFVYAFTSLIIPLQLHKSPFKNLTKGVKKLVSAFSTNQGSAIAFLIIGCGAALMAYNFLTGTAEIENSIIAVAAFYLSIKSLSEKIGFLKNIIKSVENKYRKNRGRNPSYINHILAGWTTGFVLAIPISTIPFSMVGYTLGLLMMVIAVVLILVLKNKKEEAKA